MVPSWLNKNLEIYEEIVVLSIFYNFMKIIVIGSLVELIWPTHFFNKKNNVTNLLKFRSFNEALIKLRPIDFKKNLFNKLLINTLILRRKKLKKKKR